MGFNDTLFVCLSENDTACRVYGHKGRDWFYDKGDAAMAEYINQCSSGKEANYTCVFIYKMCYLHHRHLWFVLPAENLYLSIWQNLSFD